LRKELLRKIEKYIEVMTVPLGYSIEFTFKKHDEPEHGSSPPAVLA